MYVNADYSSHHGRFNIYHLGKTIVKSMGNKIFSIYFTINYPNRYIDWERFTIPLISPSAIRIRISIRKDLLSLCLSELISPEGLAMEKIYFPIDNPNDNTKWYCQRYLFSFPWLGKINYTIATSVSAPVPVLAPEWSAETRPLADLVPSLRRARAGHYCLPLDRPPTIIRPGFL